MANALTKRLLNLERLANPKQPMLVMSCYERPDDEQLAQIEDAERSGRRVIVFGSRYAWCWISGAETKPWLENNTDYNYVRG